MNIIADLTRRIEEYRATNKQPCKNYATEAAAEKATSEMAQACAEYFYKLSDRKNIRSARYVVFFIPAWGRWVGGIDQTEVTMRESSTGGYMGFCKGFFVY